MVNLGRSIKAAMKQNNMAVFDLAVEMKCSRQNVYQWIKSGKINLSTLVRLCTVFQMKLSDFIAMGESDE